MLSLVCGSAFELSCPAMLCLLSRRGPQRSASPGTCCCSFSPLQHHWWPLGDVLFWITISLVFHQGTSSSLVVTRPTTGVRWANLMVGHQGQEQEAAYTPYTPLWGPVFSVMDSEVLMPAHIFCGPLWSKHKCQVTHRGLNSQLSHLCAMIKYLQLCLC